MIVSLGSTCCIAHQLKKLEYKTGYPFDYCNISINKLISVLRNNFDFYTNLNVLKLSDKHKTKDEKSSLILKNEYNIKFAHEILYKYELEDFKLKLGYRIEKFKSLENPIFIRYECSIVKNIEEKYNKLKKELDKYFTRYKLIIICHKDNKNSMESYYYDNFIEDWKRDDLDWKKIIENIIKK